MKKVLWLILLGTTLLNAYSTKLINGYAVSIYDKNMHEENIQGKSKTNKNYNGICYTKVYIFGKILNGHVKVKIDNALGHQISVNPIHKNRLIIGKEILFKHYGVKKGYLELYFDDKLLDAKTFVQ